MGEVKPLPLSAAHALKITRETAEDSSRIGIPADLGFDRPRQEWEHVVTGRQIKRCIEDGEILGKPSIDQHGNHEVQLFRFGGGEEVKIKIVLVNEESDGWQIFVTEWSKSDGHK